MKNKNDKNQKLDYFSENLAVPEVHVGGSGDADEAPEDDSGRDEVVFENLAFPEIKIHKNPKKD